MESAFCPAEAIKNDADFRLIETFGYVPGQAVTRLDLHLHRLAASAAYFGIAFDRASVMGAIEAIQGPAPLRCRLTLTTSGGVEITTAQMPPVAKTWRFAIATEFLQADDPFLLHKSTRRGLYDRVRAGLADGLDEMLFLNHRGEICEGTISNIAVQTPDGRWLTPPTVSGCLPGICRQDLLDQGALCEAVLMPADLVGARDIKLMNALRGAIAAQWSPLCAVKQEYYPG
ncbi:aminotransferase class IV family protein [Pseudophaeobacter sp.]|uniref:aminotransferase class IV family protein n=1 Tax=Pseudophaeobacter sp. TaxID=1971739 RepID=UPI0040596287